VQDDAGGEVSTVVEDDAASQHYDIVLLTDCVFSTALTEDLVATILSRTAEKATVICCHEIRDEVWAYTSLTA
jgi:predicted nicotinamide N-methyase